MADSELVNMLAGDSSYADVLERFWEAEKAGAAGRENPLLPGQYSSRRLRPGNIDRPSLEAWYRAQVAANIRQGMTPDEAENSARLMAQMYGHHFRELLAVENPAGDGSRERLHELSNAMNSGRDLSRAELEELRSLLYSHSPSGWANAIGFHHDKEKVKERLARMENPWGLTGIQFRELSTPRDAGRAVGRYWANLGRTFHPGWDDTVHAFKTWITRRPEFSKVHFGQREQALEQFKAGIADEYVPGKTMEERMSNPCHNPMYFELAPAYGRDYKTKAEVIAAWEAGKDFEGDFQLGFKPVNKPQIEAQFPGSTVLLRFSRNTKFAKVQVGRRGNPGFGWREYRGGKAQVEYLDEHGSVVGHSSLSAMGRIDLQRKILEDAPQDAYRAKVYPISGESPWIEQVHLHRTRGNPGWTSEHGYPGVTGEFMVVEVFPDFTEHVVFSSEDEDEARTDMLQRRGLYPRRKYRLERRSSFHQGNPNDTGVGDIYRSHRALSLYDSIRVGSRVTIVNQFGQEHTGRAVMLGPGGWVLNMGGRHGTPGIAVPENIVRVSGGARRNPDFSHPDVSGWIRVSAEEVERFKRHWPASGLPDDTSISFEFDLGDLVDIEMRRHGRLVDHSRYDGPALVALSQDAQEGKIGKRPGERRSGVRRSNPESEAAELYEEFHGKPSDSIVEVPEEVHYHEHLAALGDLVELVVEPTVGKGFVVISFKGSGVILSSNESGTQLYLVGGDQTLDLKEFGLKGAEAEKESVVVGVLCNVTYKTRKGFDKFELFDYEHKLGEETGHQPLLIYDTLNNAMSVSGGAYKIKPEGIVD